MHIGETPETCMHREAARGWPFTGQGEKAQKKRVQLASFFFWLPWDFVDVHGLSLVVASGCYSLALCRASHCGSSSCCRARALGCGSVVVGRRLSCSSVCGILQDQGWARVPCTGGRIPNHWTAREILLRASRSWISRLRNWEKINSI